MAPLKVRRSDHKRLRWFWVVGSPGTSPSSWFWYVDDTRVQMKIPELEAVTENPHADQNLQNRTQGGSIRPEGAKKEEPVRLASECSDIQTGPSPDPK